MTNRLIWYKKENKHIQRYYFQYRDGFTRVENLSEELDSMTIIIDRIDKQDFEPFDVVDILAGEQNTRVMLIDKISEVQVAFDDDKYTYTLQLMSLTKKLERTVVPCFSVTKPLNKNAISVYQALKNLLSDYAPQFLYSGNSRTTYYQSLYRISDRLKEKTQNVSCPDIQITNATLREAIDRILSVVKCICVLKPEGYLDYVDIDKHETGEYESKEIVLDDLPQLNYLTENQDSGEYATELENNYRNVVQNTKENQFVKIQEYISLRSDNSAWLNTDDLILFTARPIYQLNSLKMSGTITYTAGGQHYQGDYNSYDLTRFVLEESELKISDYNTQLKSLAYTRGSPNITNFDKSTKRFFREYTCFERIIQEITGEQTAHFTSPSDIIAIHFTVEYYSQVDNLKMRSGKYLPETNDKNVIVDNPTEAFVDIKQQGILFNQKANRLGNRIKTLQGRFEYEDIDLVPNIGDTLGNFVVIRTEKQYYDDFLLVKAILSENFVNINYFTGINARRRSWNVVTANEAFDKELLNKYYLEFSKSRKVGIDVNNGLLTFRENNINFVENILKDALTNDTISKSICGSIVWTPDSGEELRTAMPIDYGKYFFLETSAYISGNSLVFNCGFDGNKSNGLRISNTLGDALTLKTIQRYGKYTNDDGQTTSFSMMLVNSDYYLGYGTKVNSNYYVPRDRDGSNYTPTFETDIACDYPKVYIPNDAFDKTVSDTNVFYTRFFNHKDSRETVNLNLQFEFCSDTPNIIIGRKFLERQGLVNGIKGSIQWAYTDQVYKYGDEKLKTEGSAVSFAPTVTFQTATTDNTYEQSSCKCTLTSDVTPSFDVKSIVLYDGSTDEIILAINLEDEESISNVSFYLNLLSVRDRKVYIDRDMKLADDEIGESNYFEKRQSSLMAKYGLITYDDTTTHSYVLNPAASQQALENGSLAYNYFGETKDNSDVIKNGYSVRRLFVEFEPNESGTREALKLPSGKYLSSWQSGGTSKTMELYDTPKFHDIHISSGIATITATDNEKMRFSTGSGVVTDHIGFIFSGYGNSNVSIYGLSSTNETINYFEQVNEVSTTISALIGCIDYDENTGNAYCFNCVSLENGQTEASAINVDTFNDEKIKSNVNTSNNTFTVQSRELIYEEQVISNTFLLRSLYLNKCIGIDDDGKFILDDLANITDSNGKIVNPHFAFVFESDEDENFNITNYAYSLVKPNAKLIMKTAVFNGRVRRNFLMSEESGTLPIKVFRAYVKSLY